MLIKTRVLSWVVLMAGGLAACGSLPTAMPEPTAMPPTAPASATAASSATHAATATSVATSTPETTATAGATPTFTPTRPAPPPTLTLLPTPRPAAIGTAVPEAQPLTATNLGGLARLARWPVGFQPDSLVFSTSGRGLWAAGPEQAEVWRVRDGVLIRRARGPALSPDGVLAVDTYGAAAKTLGGLDDLVYVLTDLAAGAERTRWQDPKPAQVSACDPNRCATLRFAPNAGSVAEIEDYSGGRERPTLKLWGVDGRLLWTAPGVQTVTYAPDGLLLVTRRATTPPIDIWRVRDGALLKSLTPGIVVTHVAVTADGTRLALADAAQVQIWPWAVGAATASWPAAEVQSLAFNADGSLLVGGFVDRIAIWSTADGQLVWEQPVTAGGPAAVAADGRLVALFSDGALEVWGVPAR